MYGEQERRFSAAPTTYLLGQREEVLMQGEYGPVERSVVRVPGDHARVLLHAVPVSWGTKTTSQQKATACKGSAGLKRRHRITWRFINLVIQDKNLKRSHVSLDTQSFFSFFLLCLGKMARSQTVMM